MSITLFGITNCDTVKKARAWLAQEGVDYTFHDFKKQGVPQDALDRWISQVGWEKLVNRQGTTWRKLDPAMQARVKDAASARALMLEQPSVIKRPVVQWDARQTTVGFDADAWSGLSR
ncbi:ArsC family reductase [Ramlibacter albus]|uniref:ArsC family reductase n=1 Tax=Ramlibacter albus TaxID=2079448 RepID=A0A923MBX1_9BURK|nr:ArsC family reductase [Ramlibacter albus]MBC5767341.1 ArsC family reductase [Ramlibacter albus]